MTVSERPDGERFRASAAVDRYLDALAFGQPTGENGLDPGLAATLDRLHAVHAAASPDPAFVRRLREELMDYAEPVIASHGTNGVVQDVGELGVATARGRMVVWPGRLHRRRARVELATVAILLLTLVAGFMASRLAVEPGGGGRPSGFAPGTSEADAVPTVTPVMGGAYVYGGAVEIVPGIMEGSFVVVTEDGVPMRERPSLMSKPVTLLRQGTELEVIGPRIVGEGYVWWLVRETLSNRAGYVGADFLEPLNGMPQQNPTATPLPTPRPGDVYVSADSEIREGSIVVVTEDGVNIRPEPSTESDAVTQLQQGAELVVTGPSVATDDIVWWPVREPLSNQEGFVGGDFLEPIGEDVVIADALSPPTPFPTALPADVQVGATVVSVRDIELRATPAMDGAVIASFVADTAFVVVGPRVTTDGGAWWPVQEERSGATGYIMEGFLRLTDAPLVRVVVVAPSPTTIVAPSPQPAGIDPEIRNLSVQVDLAGLLVGDQRAEEAARAALRDVLKPYLGCRVGVTITYAHAPSVGQGVELARAINVILSDEFPAVFAETGFRDVSSGMEPYGQVEMELFFYSGCQERHETPAVGSPVSARPVAGRTTAVTTGQAGEIAILITATADIQLQIEADGSTVFNQLLPAGESTG